MREGTLGKVRMPKHFSTEFDLICSTLKAVYKIHSIEAWHAWEKNADVLNGLWMHLSLI